MWNSGASHSPVGLVSRQWDGHTVHKLSQRRLTAEKLTPRESDCWRMHSNVSSDWLPSSFKVTRPVLQILKMAGYFPDNPHIFIQCPPHTTEVKSILQATSSSSGFETWLNVIQESRYRTFYNRSFLDGDLFFTLKYITILILARSAFLKNLYILNWASYNIVVMFCL